MTHNPGEVWILAYNDGEECAIAMATSRENYWLLIDHEADSWRGMEIIWHGVARRIMEAE